MFISLAALGPRKTDLPRKTRGGKTDLSENLEVEEVEEPEVEEVEAAMVATPAGRSPVKRRRMARRNDWVFSIDLKDAYLNVLLREGQAKFQ